VFAHPELLSDVLSKMHKSTGIFHFISDGQSSKSVAEKQRKLFKKGLAHVCLFFVGRKVCSPLHLSNNR